MAEQKSEQKSMWTPRDLELLTAGIQCMNEGLPNASQLDIAKFSEMTGLAQNSARTAWSTLRKKSLVGKEDIVAPKTPGSGPSEKKKAPRKRKSTGEKKGENGEDVDGGENDEITGETPTKKPRGRPAKCKAAEANEEGDSEMKDDAEMPAATPAKKKPTPSKPAVKKTKAPSKTPEAEAEASPGAGDDDSEMKDDNEAPAVTPAKKKPASRKLAVKKAKATTTPEASPRAGDDDSEIKDDVEVPTVTPAKAKAAPKKTAVKKITKAKSTTPDVDVEASPAAAEDDSEMKDDAEVLDVAPARKTITPKKPVAKKTAKATSKTPEADADAEVPEKASSEPAQLSSDDTAHGSESITVESAKEIVQVEVTNGKTEVTVTEKKGIEEVEEVATS